MKNIVGFSVKTEIARFDIIKDRRNIKKKEAAYERLWIIHKWYMDGDRGPK
jgi:hypothetical protein